MEPEFKQRKKSDKGKASTPIFGFIALMVFGAFSWLAAPTLRDLIEDNLDYQFSEELSSQAINGILAFIIFVVLFGFAMIFWAAMGGGATSRDPLDAPPPSRKKRKRRG